MGFFKYYWKNIMNDKVSIDYKHLLNHNSRAASNLSLFIKKKKEEQTIQSYAEIKAVEQSTEFKINPTVWGITNLIMTPLVACGAITLAQSPVKTISLNLIKNKSAFPSMSNKYKGFSFIFHVINSLYRGTQSSLAGGLARTAYNTSARKRNENIEEQQAYKNKLVNLYLYLAIVSAAFGEVLITGPFQNAANLKKVQGIIPAGFKWFDKHNLLKLTISGIAPRLLTSTVNFASIFIIEEKVAKLLCGTVKNDNLNHVLSGALSGACAATFSYLPAIFEDHRLLKTKVNNGRLINKNSFVLMQELFKEIQNDPKGSFKNFAKDVPTQLGLRVILTAMIFSILSGVTNSLGDEPLKKMIPEKYHPIKQTQQGFFSESNDNKITVQQKKPLINHTDTKEISKHK
jgi:hypothetical protein